MPILNYTTTIKSEKTVGEIQAILSKHGASSISVDYTDGQPSAVTFLVEIRGRYINFRLPSNADGVLKALSRQRVQARYKTSEHAQRVAWRIVKDWVAAQMAIVEANVAHMKQVFLPYAVAPDGRTLFDHFTENPTKLLAG